MFAEQIICAFFSCALGLDDIQLYIVHAVRNCIRWAENSWSSFQADIWFLCIFSFSLFSFSRALEFVWSASRGKNLPVLCLLTCNCVVSRIQRRLCSFDFYCLSIVFCFCLLFLSFVFCLLHLVSCMHLYRITYSKQALFFCVLSFIVCLLSFVICLLSFAFGLLYASVSYHVFEAGFVLCANLISSPSLSPTLSQQKWIRSSRLVDQSRACCQSGACCFFLN